MYRTYVLFTVSCFWSWQYRYGDRQLLWNTSTHTHPLLQSPHPQLKETSRRFKGRDLFPSFAFLFCPFWEPDINGQDIQKQLYLNLESHCAWFGKEADSKKIWEDFTLHPRWLLAQRQPITVQTKRETTKSKSFLKKRLWLSEFLHN